MATGTHLQSKKGGRAFKKGDVLVARGSGRADLEIVGFAQARTQLKVKPLNGRNEGKVRLLANDRGVLQKRFVLPA